MLFCRCLTLAALALPLLHCALAKAEERVRFALPKLALPKLALPSPVLAKLDASREKPALRFEPSEPGAVSAFTLPSTLEPRPEFRVLYLPTSTWFEPLNVAWKRTTPDTKQDKAARRMLESNVLLGIRNGVSRAMQDEEQRRLKALTASELEASGGASSRIMGGDLAGAASVAANFVSFNFNLARKRESDLFALSGGAPSDPRFSFGFGLGRLGLKVRSEF